jgi:3-phenylpropionate/trans-cinnamate dioxygenase ferredoxin subunit
MPGLPTAAFRAIGQDDAIPDGFVVPFYLNDRKLRISVARVGDHLYALGDLCTCAGHAAAASLGESDG